jgi:hypothetical protein
VEDTLPGPRPPSVDVTAEERCDLEDLVLRHKVDDLTIKVLAFIDHDNRTARPFRWTYQGKTPTAKLTTDSGYAVLVPRPSGRGRLAFSGA